MTVWFGVHLWCGFGATGGQILELRLGFIRVGCCKGAVMEHIRQARSRLESTLKALVRGAWNS